MKPYFSAVRKASTKNKKNVCECVSVCVCACVCIYFCTYYVFSIYIYIYIYIYILYIYIYINKSPFTMTYNISFKTSHYQHVSGNCHARMLEGWDLAPLILIRHIGAGV